MNTIPAEITLAIARTADEKDLHALTLVNRHFYTVANPMLWRDVEIRNERQYIQLLQGSALSKGGLFQHLRRLTIDIQITDALFLTLLQLLPPVLENLELTSAKHITDESLEHLPSQCPQLTSLYIHHGAFTNVTMVSVGQHCHRLRRLYLEECYHVSPHLLTALIACPLEEIDIDVDFNGTTWDDETARQFARDVATFSRLEVLSLSHIDQVMSRHLLDRKGVLLWPRLTKCYLRGYNDMEDEDVIRFIKTHPQLKKLELFGNDFSDTVLYAIADTLPHLTYLDLSASRNFTHHGVRRIVLKCPLLTNFVLDATQLKRSDFPELGPYSNEYLAISDDLEWATQLGDLWQYDMDIIRRAANDNNDDANGSDE
ncbi:unnamed protein product [Absidia cylindrospora]